MKKISNISAGFLYAALFAVLFLSCQDDARWYPSADVEIVSYAEYVDISGPKLAVTLVIHNTGNTSITSSTVTIRAQTNRREYLQTGGASGKINPGGKVALTITAAYFEAGEALVPGGLGVYDSFFD